VGPPKRSGVHPEHFPVTSPSRVPIYRGGGVLLDERASPTVALFLRVPAELHAELKRVAAAHEETLTRLVQRALCSELQGMRAGHLVAQAIRNRPSRQSSDSTLKTSE
jgi:hypothetical protein